MPTGDKASKNQYGGDAYTGIQNASAQTATNIVNLASIQKIGFGSILLVAGCVLIIVGIPEKISNDASKRIRDNNSIIDEYQSANSTNNVNSSQVDAMHEVDTINRTAAHEVNSRDSFEEIKKAKAELDSGAISQEEFDSKKKELLDI